MSIRRICKDLDLTQTSAVLMRLRIGPLTPLQALRELGVFRLAARVCELRGAGHRVEARLVTVKTRGGKARVCQYHLTHR